MKHRLPDLFSVGERCSLFYPLWQIAIAIMVIAVLLVPIGAAQTAVLEVWMDINPTAYINPPSTSFSAYYVTQNLPPRYSHPITH
jgi:hypothetical protein